MLMKPLFPIPAPELSISPVRLVLMNDSTKYSNGSLSMDVARIDVKDDDGKELGYMGSGIVGNWTIQIGTALYRVDMKEFWKVCKAFHDAHEESLC